MSVSPVIMSVVYHVGLLVRSMMSFGDMIEVPTALFGIT
jgi:hypothetical protein